MLFGNAGHALARGDGRGARCEIRSIDRAQPRHRQLRAPLWRPVIFQSQLRAITLGLGRIFVGRLAATAEQSDDLIVCPDMKEGRIEAHGR